MYLYGKSWTTLKVVSYKNHHLFHSLLSQIPLALKHILWLLWILQKSGKLRK